MKKFVSFVIYSLFLAGCVNGVDTPLDDSTFDTGTTAESSVPVVTASASEAEVCRILPDLAEHIGPQDDEEAGFIEASELIAHARGIIAVLQSDGSDLVQNAQSLIDEYETLVTVRYSDLDAFKVGETKRALESVASQAQVILDWCRGHGQVVGEETISGSLSQVYPNGAWSEGANQSFFWFMSLSTQNETRTPTGALEYFANGELVGTQLFIQATCNTETKIMDVSIFRKNEDLSDKDFGPSGEVLFKYSVDGAPLKEGKGSFNQGVFTPYLFDGNTQADAAREAIENLLTAGESLRIVVDSPGSQIDDEFFVSGSSRLLESFEQFGCLDY